MRSVSKIAIKGIFKRKTYTIAIFFLTVVAAVSMVTALATITRTQDIFDAAYKKSNSPDIFYFYLTKNYSQDFKSFFKKRSEVKSVMVQTCLYHISTVGSVNGKDLSSPVLCEYNPKENDYNLSTAKTDKTLSDNEVYVPLIYKSEYNAKAGDKLTIKVNEDSKAYTIAGFFEDPVYGSSFTGWKRILFSAKGYRQAETFTLNKTTVHATIMNVYLKDKYQGAFLEKASEAINKDFVNVTLASFQTDKTMFELIVTIIPKIISVILLCFSALLMLIAVIVIRHAILSSIEADYVSLGVLKAIGFTGKNIIASILLQYLIIGGIGTIAGVIAGIFTTPVMAEVLMNSTGIFGKANLTLPIALVVILAILAVIGLIAYLTARKAAKISPVMAISFGKAPVHFSSRLNVPLSRLDFLPLTIRMSLKQMMTKLKQYSTLIVITTIFTFMIITVMALTNNFGSIENMSRIFGSPMYDLDIASTNAKLCSSEKLDRIVREIDKTYGVKSSSFEDYVSIKIDSVSVSGIIRNNFKMTEDSVIDGKLPEFDNEVAITPIISEILGKGVGETVEIEKDGVKKKYLITCTMQNISEMGKVICLSQPAYKRLVPDYQSLTRSIILKNNSDVNGIISALKQKYKTSGNELSFSDDKDSFNNVFSTIQQATGFASTIVLLLTFLLIACITLLLCTITIYREITDTGIFKAIGFKTKELRMQFALRFMFISITGGAIGTVLSMLFDGRLIKTMLSSVGIANLKPIWNFYSLGLPFLFVVVVAGITAFLCSIRIKKISPSNLINE